MKSIYKNISGESCKTDKMVGNLAIMVSLKVKKEFGKMRLKNLKSLNS